jgi:hypothetical protein
VLVQDKSFKKYAKVYAEDVDLFFKEYVSLCFNPESFLNQLLSLASPQSLPASSS